MWGTLSEGAWVAIQVQCRMEQQVCVGLQERSYETFLPLVARYHRHKGESILQESPLFAGYLFCRWSNTKRHLIVQVPGVRRIVGAGNTPLPVDDTELAAIRTIVNSKLLSRPWRFLHEGNRVRISGGPLRGMEAILVALAGDRYAVVNITLMRRAVAVKIHPSLIGSIDIHDGRDDNLHANRREMLGSMS